jgi:phosphopantothenoylcysteine synthetase/decarboxylase
VKIILGITSSISAYKACDIIRIFSSKGHSTTVVMSRNACNLVTPLTFQTLTGNRVYTDTFENGAYTMGHIALKEDAALFLCAPATANFIGKIANGIADDLISTTFLSIDAPVAIAPAMNPTMWSNAAVQNNINTLTKRGITIIDPAEGSVICGDKGQGKLAPVDQIVTRSLQLLDFKHG